MNKINNEAKVRRNTKKMVLETAKVMSYEDLEEARAQRAAKDAAKAKRKEKIVFESARIESQRQDRLRQGELKWHRWIRRQRQLGPQLRR